MLQSCDHIRSHSRLRDRNAGANSQLPTQLDAYGGSDGKRSDITGFGLGRQHQPGQLQHGRARTEEAPSKPAYGDDFCGIRRGLRSESGRRDRREPKCYWDLVTRNCFLVYQQRRRKPIGRGRRSGAGPSQNGSRIHVLCDQ
uniref:Uncharacterized protein n=1 Tax=Steinernema glaseri TaxID=37863 RepID=A0A1I7ZBD9_9BILA